MFKSFAMLAIRDFAVHWYLSTAQASIIGTYVDADTGTSGNTVRVSDGTDGTTGGWLGTGTTQWNDRNSPPQQGAYLMENRTTPTFPPQNSTLKSRQPSPG